MPSRTMTCRTGVAPAMVGLLIVLGALLVAGCTTVGKVDPALFPRSTALAGSTPNARIALVADTALTQFTYQCQRGLSKLVIPIGQIAAAAAVAALSDEFGRSVAKYPSCEAATAANGSDAPLTLVAPGPVQFERHEEHWSLPLLLHGGAVPIPTRQDVRLVVDWQVLAADGRVLWTGRYDSGDVALTTGALLSEHDPDSGQRYDVQMAHELAYRLSRQAARDVRSWIEAQQLRGQLLQRDM